MKWGGLDPGGPGLLRARGGCAALWVRCSYPRLASRVDQAFWSDSDGAGVVDRLLSAGSSSAGLGKDSGAGLKKGFQPRLGRYKGRNYGALTRVSDDLENGFIESMVVLQRGVNRTYCPAYVDRPPRSRTPERLLGEVMPRGRQGQQPWKTP